MLTLTSLSIQVGTEERYELLHVLEFTRYSYYMFLLCIYTISMPYLIVFYYRIFCLSLSSIIIN